MMKRRYYGGIFTSTDFLASAVLLLAETLKNMAKYYNISQQFAKISDK
jgi:hypothetical protein